eukprot:1086986-Prymnesium_polylepis.1
MSTSLCFPFELREAIARKAALLKRGTRFVCMHEDATNGGAADGGATAKLFRPLCMRNAEPRHGIPMEMSFGTSTWYAYEKVA